MVFKLTKSMEAQETKEEDRKELKEYVAKGVLQQEQDIEVNLNDVTIGLLGICNSGKTALHRAIGKHHDGKVGMERNLTKSVGAITLCPLECDGKQGRHSSLISLEPRAGTLAMVAQAELDVALWTRWLPKLDVIVLVTDGSPDEYFQRDLLGKCRRKFEDADIVVVRTKVRISPSSKPRPSMRISPGC